MNQVSARHTLKARRDDLYETPPAATRALLRTVELPPIVWEPAAGRGAIVRELKVAGIQVIATDLVAYDGADPEITTAIDFLMERRAPDGCSSCIVTNPPYKLADAFIRHGLDLVDDVFKLLRLLALEGAGRADIVDRHLHAVWAGIERLPMMHREGWGGPRTRSSGLPYAWYHFRAEPRTGPIALHRISWRGERP